jgi:hypothetical protein
MNNDASNILEKILTIVGYQDDKNNFIIRFFDLAMREAFIEYFTLLSIKRREELEGILQEKDLMKRHEQLEPYVSTEEYKKLFTEHTEKLLQDFLEKMMHTLSEEQKNNLDTYFDSLADEHTSVVPQNM